MTNTITASPDVLKDYIIQKVFPEEGGYSNDPDDAGGETMWGITAQQARAYGYKGDMHNLTQDQAIEIYRLFNWTQPQFDQIEPISIDIAKELLDLGINQGTTWPVKYLQRALNVLNNRGSLYKTIAVDGGAGAVTRGALQAYVNERGADGIRVMVQVIHALAAERYIQIAEANPTDEKYEYGWLANRAFPVS